jgi:hypothetical protein
VGENNNDGSTVEPFVIDEVVPSTPAGSFGGSIQNGDIARFHSSEVARGTPRGIGSSGEDPATFFNVLQSPTLLVAAPGFVVVESMAGVDALSIREWTVLTGTTVAHRFLRFENGGPAPFTDARFGYASDLDVNPDCCDDDADTFGDPVIGPQSCHVKTSGGTVCASVVADRAARSFEATSGHGVFNRLRSDALSNDVISGDVSVGVMWSVGDIGAGARASLRIAHVYDGPAETDVHVAAAMTPFVLVESPLYTLP